MTKRRDPGVAANPSQPPTSLGEPDVLARLAAAEQLLDTATAQQSVDASRRLVQAATALRDTATRTAVGAAMSPATRATFLRRLEEFDRRRFEATRRLLQGPPESG